MAKKVVIEPTDFKKIVDYLTALPVPFQSIEKALEVKAILLKTKIMELDIIQKEQLANQK